MPRLCHETQEKSIPKWRRGQDSVIRASLDVKCLRISSSAWKISLRIGVILRHTFLLKLLTLCARRSLLFFFFFFSDALDFFFNRKCCLRFVFFEKIFVFEFFLFLLEIRKVSNNKIL